MRGHSVAAAVRPPPAHPRPRNRKAVSPGTGTALRPALSPGTVGTESDLLSVSAGSGPPTASIPPRPRERRPVPPRSPARPRPRSRDTTPAHPAPRKGTRKDWGDGGTRGLQPVSAGSNQRIPASARCAHSPSRDRAPGSRGTALSAAPQRGKRDQVTGHPGPSRRHSTAPPPAERPQRRRGAPASGVRARLPR